MYFGNGQAVYARTGRKFIGLVRLGYSSVWGLWVLPEKVLYDLPILTDISGSLYPILGIRYDFKFSKSDFCNWILSI